VSVLIAISGWDPNPWRTRMEALLPSHEIVMLGEPFDRESIRYALSWRHPPGALKDLPNLRVIVSLGAGVDHLFSDPALPDRPIVRVVDDGAGFATTTIRTGQLIEVDGDAGVIRILEDVTE